MPTRVAIVEDNTDLLQRLVERFRYFDSIEVVLTAESGERFLSRLDALPIKEQPQVVLMDIELPGMSGIEATQRLRAQHENIEVIMCTVFEDEDKVFDSLRAGATGYLLKDATAEEVVAAMDELLTGGAPMSPAVARKVLSFVRRTSTTTSRAGSEASDEPLVELTDRELEILELIVDDVLESVIAERLFISPHTVRAHIKNIYKKLHVHTRASVVRVAIENRLLS